MLRKRTVLAQCLYNYAERIAAAESNDQDGCAFIHLEQVNASLKIFKNHCFDLLIIKYR